MNDVPANSHAKVTTDGSGLRLVGVGGTDNLTTTPDDVVSLPNHADNGARGEILDKRGEERLASEVSVVTSSLLGGGVGHLHGDELVSLGLEALDDLTNDSTLNTIGLDGNERALLVGTGDTVRGDNLLSPDILLLGEPVSDGRESDGSTSKTSSVDVVGASEGSSSDGHGGVGARATEEGASVAGTA